ncbi:MAG: hypothetical protein ACI3ZY_15035 [Parabacteroides sp.]
MTTIFYSLPILNSVVERGKSVLLPPFCGHCFCLSGLIILVLAMWGIYLVDKGKG